MKNLFIKAMIEDEIEDKHLISLPDLITLFLKYNDLYDRLIKDDLILAVDSAANIDNKNDLIINDINNLNTKDSKKITYQPEDQLKFENNE